MNQESNLAIPPIRKPGRTQILFQTALGSGVDQILKGDVIIKKLSKYQYKITFSKVYGDRFFLYQVFDNNKNNINDQRFAAYIPIKNIENAYKNINYRNTIFNKLLFTPTTIMELPDFRQFAFVINNLYFNSHKRLVFMASTKEINIQNISSKKLIQIPSGKFKHVRFDVDDAAGELLLSNVWSQIDNLCKKDPNKMLEKLDGTGSFPVCNPPPCPLACNGVTMREYIEDKQKNTPCAQAIKELSLPEGFSRLINLSSISEYSSYMVLAPCGSPC